MASVTDVIGHYPADDRGDIGATVAVCPDCYRTTAGSRYDAPILRGDESDTPTHCAQCGELIPHALTDDGRRYVAEALSAEGGDPDVLESWRAEYGAGLWVVTESMPGCLPEIGPVWFADDRGAREYAACILRLAAHDAETDAEADDIEARAGELESGRGGCYAPSAGGYFIEIKEG